MKISFRDPYSFNWSIAINVVRELHGANTGRDVIAALDSSVMTPTYRGGYLRQAALNRLRQLEAAHGTSVAFEILRPPRLSKLLFEAHLLKRAYRTITAVLAHSPEVLAQRLEAELERDADIRQRIISIGIPILLPDGERLLRGPSMKAQDPRHGWVDLTSANMLQWRKRLATLRDQVQAELAGDTSSRHDRRFAAAREWCPEEDELEVGETVAWIFTHQEGGWREKC